MSSTTHTHSSPPAPWSQAFQSHLSKLQSPEFVLSTLHPAPGSTTGYLPRARYCIYRGMWGSLPENKHNDAERNPPLYTSDLPTFTTDARMSKLADFFATGPGQATYPNPNHPNNATTLPNPNPNDNSTHPPSATTPPDPSAPPNNPPPQATGSGGGGPVEAVFWIAETGTQWRIRGTAWVVGPDVERTRGDVKGEVGSGVRALKARVGGWMRAADPQDGQGQGSGKSEGEGNGEWSWARELRAHFGNVSPGMRGTFRNPPPGQPVGQDGKGKVGQLGKGEETDVEVVGEGDGQEGLTSEEKLGQKITDLDDGRTRANFRVVVIVPEEVERTDIKDPERSRRWLWRVVMAGEGEGEGQGRRWDVQELWP